MNAGFTSDNETTVSVRLAMVGCHREEGFATVTVLE